MTLTFTRIATTDPAAVTAYIANDADGQRQALIVVWVAGMIPFVGARWSAYPAPDSDLSNDRFQQAAAFALARLDNGLELDGATVEV